MKKRIPKIKRPPSETNRKNNCSSICPGAFEIVPEFAFDIGAAVSFRLATCDFVAANMLLNGSFISDCELIPPPTSVLIVDLPMVTSLDEPVVETGGKIEVTFVGSVTDDDLSRLMPGIALELGACTVVTVLMTGDGNGANGIKSIVHKSSTYIQS